MTLGVNIDHIAVLREARKVNDPSPIDALAICEKAGVDLITIHLREDRRHIHDDDAEMVVKLSRLPVNIECCADEAIVNIVCGLKPHKATLVPEKREEVTTEGGLALDKQYDKLKKAIATLQDSDIKVSLFIEPCKKAVELSKALGADGVELHTGKYSNIYATLYSNISRTRYAVPSLNLPRESLQILLDEEIEKIRVASVTAKALGLNLAAGHGLNYQNIATILSINEIEELNIGQSIIARSVFTGLETAIKDMRALVG
jgi:pyridoxine 5-phosphate synthase